MLCATFRAPSDGQSLETAASPAGRHLAAQCALNQSPVVGFQDCRSVCLCLGHVTMSSACGQNQRAGMPFGFSLVKRSPADASRTRVSLMRRFMTLTVSLAATRKLFRSILRTLCLKQVCSVRLIRGELYQVSACRQVKRARANDSSPLFNAMSDIRRKIYSGFRAGRFQVKLKHENQPANNRRHFIPRFSRNYLRYDGMQRSPPIPRPSPGFRRLCHRALPRSVRREWPFAKGNPGKGGFGVPAI